MSLLAANALTDSTAQQGYVFIGLGIAGLIYLFVIRPSMKKKKEDPLERQPAFSTLSQQRSTERHMQNLLVELSEMARQITGQLDTRAAKLEALIQQADQRIAALRDGGGRTENAEQAALTTLRAAPPALLSAPQQPSTPINLPDPRHADVYSLADQGQAASEIATQLERPRGEVELILALRGK